LTFLLGSTSSNKRCNCLQCKLYCGLSSKWHLQTPDVKIAEINVWDAFGLVEYE
jgi:hypothetical protein